MTVNILKCRNGHFVVRVNDDDMSNSYRRYKGNNFDDVSNFRMS